MTFINAIAQTKKLSIYPTIGGVYIMASLTQNLGLKLLGVSNEDKLTPFVDWRQDINGESEDSNMNIIDEAFSNLTRAISDNEIDALFTD